MKNKHSMSDREIVELLLPSHLMATVISQAGKKGWSLREDWMNQLDTSVAAVLAPFDQLRQQLLARKTEKLTDKLLKALNADTYPEALLIIAYAILGIVDRGLHPDPTTVGVGVALALVADFEVDGEVWGCSEKVSKAKAEKFIDALRDEGFFRPSLLLPV